MRQATRDRSLPLTLPRVIKREGGYCAFCGARLADRYACESYGKRWYCNSQCHQAGRKADAAENAKKKTVAPVLAERDPQKPTESAEPIRCYACLMDLPPSEFYLDKSRPGRGNKTRQCKACMKQANKKYYAAQKERLKTKSKAVQRSVRAASPLSVPPGLDLTERQLKRCIQNLRDILDALPESAAYELHDALSVGRINGAVFEDRGGCGCLWGTLGRAFGWSIAEEGQWAKRFRQRWCAEVDLFGRIAPKDTPQTNPYAALCAKIVQERFSK